MKVALIHPNYEHKIFSENLPVVDTEFCHAPPIILAYVAAIIEHSGHEVILIDSYVQRLKKEQVLARLTQFNPDFIGFRLESYHFHTTIEWLSYFKRNLKNVKTIVGGINCLLYPDESFACPEIDYGIIGDAIRTLPNFLSRYKKKDDTSSIPGLSYWSNGKMHINPPEKNLIPFDLYPFPSRHLLPNEKYSSFLSQRKNFTIMVTSRGCPFNCVFCAIASIPYQERSPQNVIEEIEQCYHQYHIREIDFFDAVFFLNKKRILKICEGIRESKINIEWSCRSRVDVVDKELLTSAAQAGCRRIYFGIESASPVILKRINKEINLHQVKEAVSLAHKYGICSMGFFMIGNPGETNRTALETIKFSQKIDLDFVQFCKTIAKPKTELDNMLCKKGQDFWLNHLRDKNNKSKTIPRPWTILEAKEIDRLIKKAYYSFYFRPRQIMKIIFKIKSIEELFRYIRVALKMIFCNKDANGL